MSHFASRLQFWTLHPRAPGSFVGPSLALLCRGRCGPLGASVGTLLTRPMDSPSRRPSRIVLSHLSLLEMIVERNVSTRSEHSFTVASLLERRKVDLIAYGTDGVTTRHPVPIEAVRNPARTMPVDEQAYRVTSTSS